MRNRNESGEGHDGCLSVLFGILLIGVLLMAMDPGILTPWGLFKIDLSPPAITLEQPTPEEPR